MAKGKKGRALDNWNAVQVDKSKDNNRLDIFRGGGGCHQAIRRT